MKIFKIISIIKVDKEISKENKLRKIGTKIRLFAKLVIH